MLHSFGFRYLRVKSTAKKPAKPAGLDEVSESQDQMDDLLGLCSGRFTGMFKGCFTV